MFKSTFSFAFLLLSFGLFAQDQATIMSYNVLNFPTGNIAGREDTLKQLINYVEPDIFLIQELKSDSGLQLILNESFSGLTSSYAATTFVPQQSNSSSNWKLQQAMIYNTDLFGLVDEGYLMTATRDINKYQLYYRNPNLASGADTAFVFVFVTHLKSSQGTSNEEARLEMVQTLTTYLAFLPAEANVIFAGDFNVYSSEEPAYQEILDSTNYIQLKDPISTPGNWTSSSFHPKSVLTQSTRSSSIFGDGAGGGVDDRFDFVMLSSNMFYNWNTIVYEPDSYYALGNTGSCYNSSITDCNDGEWSNQILSSLYFMSDHLPIVLKLNFGVGTVGLEETLFQEAPTSENTITIKRDYVEVIWGETEAATIQLQDAVGRNIYSRVHSLNRGYNRFRISRLQGNKGMVLVSVISDNERAVCKIVPVGSN
ncbi:MAG: endonuclease/exonuclease/phosphatase family metal-dependent hydrolase [Bacteroidia bacterium]|jgi:endonuclease/exonuclease/phosphatase family metal-dependent hydrolase